MWLILFLALFFPFSLLKSQSLCSIYSGSPIDYTVGAGTAYPNSSNLPSTTLSNVTLYVADDFTIDNNFTLNNAIVKVNTGKKISVVGDFISFSLTFFTLNNTKVFSNDCNTMWNGIEMGGLTSITVTNNSIIEDANHAISAINSGFVMLHIDNSTFNRNRIGINFDASNLSGYVMQPMIQYFVNNKFTCTSKLNGTTDDYTDIGVRMKSINYPFFWNYGNTHNEFKDLDNGMDIQGIGYTNMGVDNYRFINIKNKCIVFLNCDYLSVINSHFNNIDRVGIDFTNSKTLYAKDNYFTLLQREQSIPFSGRFMINITNPKIDNSLTILHNDFLFLGKLRALSRAIELQDDGTETLNINAYISGNFFKQYNDYNAYSDNTIGYSIGLNLAGNYASGSDIDIENNDFILDANNAGNFPYNTGISARYGNKNNIKVIANRFKAGSGIYSEFVGSTGTGNEFTNNSTMQGGNGNLGFFVFNRDFENMKICSNVDNVASAYSYIFNGQNLNTDFISNTTYGCYSRSLWVVNNGVMGTQVQKGNKWYDSNNNFHPILEHTNPQIAIFSQFRVHTDQSILVNNNYTFFSTYFPALITPNNGDFFKKIPAPQPNDACVTQAPMALPIDPIVDPAIADGSYNRLMSNPVIEFDGQLHLQRKLKKNNNLSNSHPSLKEFSQKHELTNIGKFVKLEKDIDDIKKNKIDALRKKIQEVDKQMKQYNAAKRPTQDETKQQYKQRLELDIAISDLYKEHKKDKNLKLKTVKSDADNIVPISTHERYFKEVYQIYLDAQINTNGQFSAEQIVKLKKIAGTCVTEGGKIVYVARGFLSVPDLAEVLILVETCEKRPESSQTNFLKESESLKATSNVVNDIVTLYPNPSNDAFYLNIPKNLTGNVGLYDVTGRLVKFLNLTTGSNFIKHEAPNGVYIAKINTSDGNTKSIKFTVKN